MSNLKHLLSFVLLTFCGLCKKQIGFPYMQGRVTRWHLEIHDTSLTSCALNIHTTIKSLYHALIYSHLEQFTRKCLPTQDVDSRQDRDDAIQQNVKQM